MKLVVDTRVRDFRRTCDEALAELADLPREAADFSAGCSTTLAGLQETATRLGAVTPAMLTALDNIGCSINRRRR